MSTRDNSRVGDVSAMMRVAWTLRQGKALSVHEQRQMVADYCRMLGERMGYATPAPKVGEGLAPRLRETLAHLLSGDSEKEVAARLGISRHTVHIYVKSLYKHFEVSSRGELLCKCLRRGP